MLNTQQKLALQQVESGHNIYIGGQAGVGKSFLVTSIVHAARSRGKKVALTCTTGIACSVYDQVFCHQSYETIYQTTHHPYCQFDITI
jgi:DNA replication protein DnaC